MYHSKLTAKYMEAYSLNVIVFNSVSCFLSKCRGRLTPTRIQLLCLVLSRSICLTSSLQLRLISVISQFYIIILSPFLFSIFLILSHSDCGAMGVGGDSDGAVFTKENLKLISLNTNGLRIPAKRRAIFNDLRTHKPDICLLQETHSTVNDQKIWTSEWGGRTFFSHGRSNSKGVCFLFARDFDIPVTFSYADPNGRLAIIQFALKGETITLVNIYAPTQSEAHEQINFIIKCEEILAGLEIQNLYLGGDFNIQLDAVNTSQRNPQANGTSYRTHIQELMNDYSLMDTWKVKNPKSTRGTFHRSAYSARLDYWLIPEYLQSPSTKIDIIPHPLSDHCLLTLQTGVPDVRRGPGHWRFDNFLLTDPNFKREMTQHIETVKQEDFSNPNTRWEWIKYKIRSFCIEYKTNKNRQQKKLVKDLQDRLQFLAEKHDLGGSQEVIDEVQSIKRELKDISQIQANRAIFRAKARWAMDGEKPSSYFLGLEKRRSKDMSITTLKDESGRLLTSNQDILRREQEYFKKIYEEDQADLEPVNDLPLSLEDFPSISDLSKLLVSRPFSTEEFHSALKALNKGKSPGSDGITQEFYSAFWNSLQNPFFDSILFSIENGSLTQSQKMGIIQLIPKKGLDRLDITNWRPITLLNVDFKIFSKAIASRIQSCITQVISPDQTGFIRGRFIGTNLINIRSIMDHVESTDSTGIMLAVDYKKAFDTIRWDLIFKALEMFGFGDYLITAIKTMFHDIKTAVCNAGFSSEYFTPERGVRQGCCASPSLFTLTVELLAIMVRRSLHIRGIRVAESSYKISQYADDATFFLQDFESTEALIHLLERFTQFSGLAINFRKSHLLLLGNHRHPPTEFQGITVVDHVKILGLTFKRNISDQDQYSFNFEPSLKKINKVCQSWANRDMSLKGKATLIKSLMVSLLQYQCTCTTTPIRVIQEFKKIVMDFFWSGKRSKISYALLIQDIDHGGLALPDLETRITTALTTWVTKLWYDDNMPWAGILKCHLQIPDIKEVILSKTNWANHLPQQLVFLRQILKNWATLHIYEPWNQEGVLQETLWNNDYIKISGETQNWQAWKTAGITTIGDLWHTSLPRFLSDQEIRDKFGIQCSFLQLLQLRSALPCKWKRLLVSPLEQPLTRKPGFKSGIDSEIYIDNSSSRRIYKALVLRKLPVVSAQAKWNTLFPIDEHNLPDHWQLLYKRPYRVARTTKLQAFQYRLLMRIIPCNKYLYNIRIRQDDLCPNCGEQDTLQHFFFQCTIIHDFWTTIVQWFAQYGDLHLPLSLKNVLFGIPISSSKDKQANFIFLFVKFYLYRQRLFHQTKLELVHFLRELRANLRTEKFICDLENRPRKFSPWTSILQALG